MGLSGHSRLGFVCTDPEQVQSTVQQSVFMHQRLAVCAIATALLDKKQLTVSADQKSWLHRRKASALAVGAAKFPSHQCSPGARSAPCRCWLSAHKQQVPNSKQYSARSNQTDENCMVSFLTWTGPEVIVHMDSSIGSEQSTGVAIDMIRPCIASQTAVQHSAQKQQ